MKGKGIYEMMGREIAHALIKKKDEYREIMGGFAQSPMHKKNNIYMNKYWMEPMGFALI